MLRLSMASALAALLLFCAPVSAAPTEIRSQYNSIKWMFPEGGVISGGHPDYHDFQTYYHFSNLNPYWVMVEAYFQGDAGSWTTHVSLAPNSRTSLPFSAMSGGRVGFHAAEFYSMNWTHEIQVSSTMFNNGWLGLLWESSKAVNGSTDARQSWSFGEGGIFSAFLAGNEPAFDHFYAVYNPQGGPITVKARYYPDEIDNGGVGYYEDPPHLVRTVAGRSRLAFNPWSNAWPFNAMHARATTIECSQPCVVQMTMYQRANVGARRPNTQSSLGSKPAAKWYVVGIPTGAAWQHRMYFLNTSASPNTVRLRYRNAAGADVLNTQQTMAGSSRMSYDLSGWHPGSAPNLASPPQNMGGDNLSLEISADAPIVLTKIMYWQGNWDWSEGSNSTGHSEGGLRLVFPGGNSGGGFNNYIQVMNTGDGPTNVTAFTYRPNGSIAQRNLGMLNAKGMLQIDAGSWGVDGDFTTVIEADQPIIGEAQTMFAWESTMWRAGDAVEAIVYPTKTSFTTAPTQP